MTGWVRWTVLILAGLVALALAAAGALAFLVSRIDVRAEIERAVEGATGRDLTIAGDVGVSYWPTLGVHASDVTLSNVEGGRAPAFMMASDIHVGVELRPLFDRRIVVRRLVVQHPRVALEIDAQGRPNWLLQRAAPTAPPQQPASSPGATPSEPGFNVAETTLRAVEISSGEISYVDARRGAGWVIGDADLSTSLESLDQPMRITGSMVYADQPIEIDLRVGQPAAALRGAVTPLSLTLNSELLTASFEGRTLAASGEVAGNVRASGPSLRRLSAWSGAPIQGGVGLETFAVAGRIEIARGAYSFSNAAFALDLIRGRGDFVLSERADKPYVSGRLELFDFDLNPYLVGQAPPNQTEDLSAAVAASEQSSTPTPTAEIAVVADAPRALDVQAAPSDTPIDFSGLRAFNADLELVTAAVLVQRLRLDSTRLNLVLNDGFMAATVHNVSLYGGSGSGRFEVDARAPDISIMQDLDFSDLSAQRFLSDAINLSSIEGRAELSLDLRAHGRTQGEMIRSLDGGAYIEVVSGTLHGVDLGGVSRTIRNALRGELIAPEARTGFDGFSARFAIADGALASDNLSFNTPDLRIPGIGVIDVGQRRLDLRLAPRSPRGGIVFPFAIRGPFGASAYSGDVGDRAQREVLAHVRSVQAASRAGVR